MGDLGYVAASSSRSRALQTSHQGEAQGLAVCFRFWRQYKILQKTTPAHFYCKFWEGVHRFGRPCRVSGKLLRPHAPAVAMVLDTSGIDESAACVLACHRGHLHRHLGLRSKATPSEKSSWHATWPWSRLRYQTPMYHCHQLWAVSCQIMSGGA